MIRKCLLFFTAMIILSALSGTAALAGRLMVNIPMANVRSGPGTKYKVLWKLEKYHPLKVIKAKGDWYYFEDFEGDKAWINKDIVSDEQSVIVIRDKCNVRSGPGENYGLIFTVERGVPFKVLNRKGDWLQIRHADGDQGWIHKMLVW